MHLIRLRGKPATCFSLNDDDGGDDVVDDVIVTSMATAKTMRGMAISVTRQPNYCKIFGHQQQRKLARQQNIFAKAGSKLCQMLKSMPQTDKIWPKWRKFTKSGHTDVMRKGREIFLPLFELNEIDPTLITLLQSFLFRGPHPIKIITS